MTSGRPPSSPDSSHRRQPASRQRVRDALERLGSSESFPEPPAASAASSSGATSSLETLLEALHLTGSERVLEIGSVSGYETALLSQLAREVVSVETSPERAEARVRLLAGLGCHNVKVVVSGASEAPGDAPYQAILVASGVAELPEQLLNALDAEGRLVIPLGDATGQVAELVRKHGFEVHSEALCPCHLPMLSSAEGRPSHFPWNDSKPV